MSETCHPNFLALPWAEFSFKVHQNSYLGSVYHSESESDRKIEIFIKKHEVAANTHFRGL